MLDIKYIRENADKVQQNAKDKGYDIDISKLLKLDSDRRKLLSQSDELRTKRNDNVAKTKGTKPTPELIAEGKKIKEQLVELESRTKVINDEYSQILNSIPNVTLDGVPKGGEKDSVEVKKFGEQPTGATDHLDFAVARDWVDFERGAKVAGAKFYFLKGDLALLENAIYQFALDFMVKKGFTFMTVPHMVSSRVMTGAGFAPRTSDQSDEYAIEGEDLSLIATAEIPLTGYHADEIIDEEKLPICYVGYSPCYRKEAGTYGKFTRGLFRVHQFNKLEMYAYTLPEKSVEMHEAILKNEEDIWQAIGVPYHVVNIAAGDLGAPAAKKYDLEYWSPVDNMYRELTSCSNCTDYQTRSLNIRVRRKNGEVEVLHSLNGTVVSLARSLVAVLENFQDKDGTFIVPQVLQPYLNGRKKL
ncbi:MAG: serine--tRNA ligase [Candidatus Saccharibacteria bacterium]|nr:serine--tRNA ligase [Candidatus Saccharibacteria bacterium]